MTRPLRVMFFVEGFTDIRFVVGLSEICELTMVVPARQYADSGLKERVAASAARLRVVEIPGGRLAFQARSLAYLWRTIREFEVVLSQEVLRGSANATLIGRLRGVPVITYMGISPLEYFRCRRERGQISAARSTLGDAVISTLMHWNGRLATRTLTMGDYLRRVALRYGPCCEAGMYYGVDTEFYAPLLSDEARAELRRRLDLPPASFIVFFASRVIHEKDPETVLRAVSAARAQGLDAMALNLGGGFREFVALAREMRLPDAERWVLGRPAAHPMTELADYYRAADVTAQASLAEGLGISPMESLACGTPVVVTAVGGLRGHLDDYARVVARRDDSAMARELLWIASHRDEARAQALRGREYVCREWSRRRAFEHLRQVLEDIAGKGGART